METFKVGDEVEITGVDLPDPYSVGARGKIVRKSIVGWWIKFESGEYNTLNGSTWVALEGQLRHVPPAQPAAPAVTSRAVVLEVEGVEYTASFNFINEWTTVILVWMRDGKIIAKGGSARRNPHDTYCAETGMRVAMRRACGIEDVLAVSLPAVYRAFRKWQHDQAAPQSKQVKPLVVGAEVVAVRDDYSGGEYFRKGARGEIVVINMGNHSQQYYLVQFTSGEFNRDACAPRQTTANGQWWAMPDEIRRVK